MHNNNVAKSVSGQGVNEDAETVRSTGAESTTEQGSVAVGSDVVGSADVVDSELARDTLFELLKNERRRETLAYLKANDGRATLSDLAEHIAARENDLPVEAISSKQRKRVYIGLYQCHLPKMANAGVVDYEKNRGTVALTDLAAQLDPYLAVEAADAGDAATAGARGLAPASAAFAVVGFAAIAGAVGVPAFVAVPAAVWAALAGVSLLGAAALPFLRD